MNWGNRLMLVFICFALLIGTLVYKSMHTKFELVSKDYYTDELHYQDKIDGRTNAARLADIIVSDSAGNIVLLLPENRSATPLTGEAWFYCSSNAANDRKIGLNTANGTRQVINKKELAKTGYQLKLSWQYGEEKFYHEQLLTVR